MSCSWVVIVVALDDGFFDGSIHPSTWSLVQGGYGLVSPCWMPWASHTLTKGCPRKRGGLVFPVTEKMCELDAVVCQHVWI